MCGGDSRFHLPLFSSMIRATALEGVLHVANVRNSDRICAVSLSFGPGHALFGRCVLYSYRFSKALLSCMSAKLSGNSGSMIFMRVFPLTYRSGGSKLYDNLPVSMDFSHFISQYRPTISKWLEGVFDGKVAPVVLP